MNNNENQDRRNFLKSVGLSALAANSTLLAGCGGGDKTPQDNQRRVHFALPALVSSTHSAYADEFVLELPSGERMTISKHEPDSLALLSSSHPVAAGLKQAALSATHFADVEALPATTPSILRVLRKSSAPGLVPASLHLTSIYLPSEVKNTNYQPHVNALREKMGLPTRNASMLANAFSSSSSADDFLTPYSTAIAIIYHHPELMSLDASQAAIIKAHIEASPFLAELWSTIANQPDSSRDGPAWCKTVQLQDDVTGEPLLFSDGSFIYDYQVSDEIMALAGLVMEDALRTVKADLELQEKCWSTVESIASRQLSPSAPMAGASGYDIASSLANGQRQGGVTFNCRMVDPAKRKIEVVMSNRFIRNIGVYLEFIDAEGRSQKVSTDVLNNSLTTRLPYPKDNIASNWFCMPGNSALLGTLGATSTIMGIPSQSGLSTHLITIPVEYSGVRLKLGTLGYDSFWSKEGGDGGTLVFTQYLIGVLSTAFINMALPIYFLATGTGMKSDGFWKDLVNDIELWWQMAVAIIPTISQLNILFNSSQYPQIEVERAWSQLKSQWGGVLKLLADRLIKFIFKSAGGAIFLIRLAAEMTGQQIVGAIPFIGWGLRAASVIATGARLAQTTIECASSSGAVVNTILLSVDLHLTINPDLASQTFPAGAGFYHINVQKEGATFFESGWIPVQDAPISMILHKIPSGGTGKIFVLFCDKPNGTLMGKGIAATYAISHDDIAFLKKGYADYEPLPEEFANKLLQLTDRRYSTTQSLISDLKSIWGTNVSFDYLRSAVGLFSNNDIPMLLNDGSSSALNIECTIQELLTPITANTRYAHDQRLTYFENSYLWLKETTPPPIVPLSCDNAEGALCELGGITLSQLSGQLGYSWRAASSSLAVCGSKTANSQAYTAQNISLSSNPNASLQTLNQGGSACGLTQGVALIYQLMGPSDGSGNNFLLDGRSGTLHVRPINTMAENSLSLDVVRPSYGTFFRLPTAVVWHPGNYLVGVHASIHKIEVLDLNTGSVDRDAMAPAAQLLGGLGMRPGLLRGPTCVATTLSGAVLVLESIAQRVQALDIHGSPIPLFNVNSKPSSFFSLHSYDAEVTYLDMGVEATGFIYILSHTHNGLRSTDFNLDIYAPSGSLVSTTKGFSAARMVVNLWRTVYTLNWQAIKGQGGRTEPSVSSWIPVTPSST